MAAFARFAFLLVVAAPFARADDRYQPLIEKLRPWVTREVKDKGIPGLSLALVDDQKIVWAEGFGHADLAGTRPMTADTVVRPGSISKLVTDLALMKLVEEGKVDLDAPITEVLPELQIVNPSDRPITLRMLVAHRAGIIREPSKGSYFDATSPSLKDTVLSLNGTKTAYPPGSHTKYSNAGIAIVGRVVETKNGGRSFEQYIRDEILKPLGMDRSDFDLTDALRADLAEARMWTYHGTDFPAPTFKLGTSSAGNLYSTVNDLGRFLMGLFRGGVVVKPETLRAMWTPQVGTPDEASRFGIGFVLGTFEDKQRVGHAGAIYGFASELAALPEEKLGVAVVATLDCANTTSRRIADEILHAALALKAGKPITTPTNTDPVAPVRANQLAGVYTDGKRQVELFPREGRFYAAPKDGDRWLELRSQPGGLVIDGPQAHGATVIPLDGAIVYDGKRLERTLPPFPPEPPKEWLGLIGEYGWDHNILYILEREGKLYALIEWFFFYPLEQVTPDRFDFPKKTGLYDSESLVFTRDPDGKATQVEAAGVVFPRRKLDGEDGSTFQVKPTKPVDELRAEALKSKPPVERQDLRKPELVDLTTLSPTIKLDIRYATDNNFLGTPFYTSARAFLQKPAAEALGRAHASLAKHGYGILAHDGYRPWYVTKMFWDGVEPRYHGFVANPARGSRHNRGCAIDLSLYDLATGRPVTMVGGYDEFSDRSGPHYPGGTSRQRWLRRLLWQAMTEQGFEVIDTEWWHFDYKDWAEYPILNQTFEDLK